jgi:HEAT repeat protein
VRSSRSESRTGRHDEGRLARSQAVRRGARLALAVLAVASCGRSARESEHRVEASPYLVTVDLAAQIRELGEETLTADEAGEQLAALGPAAIPALAAALEREPDDVRQKAVEVLSVIGTAAAVPPLLAAADGDASLDVRGDALRALGTMGDARAVPVLEKALADERLPIRAGGVVGCATLCTSPQAIDRLADIAISDQDGAVALAARASLAAIRRTGPAADRLVRSALERRRPAALAAGATPDVRALAALLASDIDGDDSLPALVAGLGASPMLQRQIAWRLGAIGDARCVAPLGALLASGDPTVRLYAYDALVKLDARGVTEARDAAAAYAGPKPRAPLAAPDV